MTNQIYIDNGNGIVTNMTEGLMWQKETLTIIRMNWEDSKYYCENLNINGFTGWRLPTIQELLSLVDYSTYNPAIGENYFPDTISSFYWSSTPHSYYIHGIWGVDFYYGYDNTSHKFNGFYVRAVRNL